MVQFLERPKGLGERLAGAVQSAVPGVAGALGQHYQQKQSNEEFKKLTGIDVSKYSPEIKNQVIDLGMKQVNQREIVQELINQGVPPDQATLYAKLTTGGQTQFIKDLLESKKRGGFGSRRSDRAQRLIEGQPSEGQMQERQEQVQLSPEEEAKETLAEVKETLDEGLTPAEKVKRGSERFKEGYPIFKDAADKLRGFGMDKERLNILESLNKSEKLPKNLARLNVDKEGNLRLPFAASPEAQRYVKTLNEFSSGAKDTFGSRVTNFDLAQYLKRFPTLLNSSEGRKQLIQQMKIVNDINSVYYKNLKEVFEKAGGVRKIDADQASSIAEKMSEGKVKELVSKFERIGSFESKPAASEFKGAKIRDKTTGEILQSDGTNWLPVK